jgi:predicted AAA+ superfamily ATPase
MDSIRPVWEVCTPRKDVVEGRLLSSELALSLSDLVWGRASPPYNDPKTFLDATHPTATMKTIVGDVIRRLRKEGGDINPVIMLDVGFGGGKTHTLACLYYSAKFGATQLSSKNAPSNTIVVAISGDEYDSKGVKRDNIQVKTIWGDLLFQIGKYQQYQ